jgi:peroxiredoxin Q/BCP
MKAADFSLPDQNGKTHTLSQYRGKWVVLYFYPRDDTPGCTREACNFRDSFRVLEKMDVVILGVSKDLVESHRKFAKKYNLNFPLLSDPEKQVIKEYKAWGKKKFLGKEFEGTLRTTYLIGPQGEIKKVYAKVNPLSHAGEIIKDLKTETDQ